MTTPQSPARTCPSSMCAPGNLLIGVVRPDGTLAPVRPPLELDAVFVDRATAGERPAEARMRFAGPCVTSQCRHWRDQRCGVADLAADAAAAGVPAELPACPIRATCRWWAQRGAAACRVCQTIVHTRYPDSNG
ncbi:hypothetical protein [Dactylosporangium sp. CA-092794]|uniref:hypothetical protein n=1 Tax=Dactylosporangium sp. CA-092794 TaxID=3239929 RepID=UPI003D8AA835